MVTWGARPVPALPFPGPIPVPAAEADMNKRKGMDRALEYMALKPGTRLSEIRIERAFIGSRPHRPSKENPQFANIEGGHRKRSRQNDSSVCDEGRPVSCLLKEEAE